VLNDFLHWQSNVVLYNGENDSTEKVLDGLCFANGVILSPNRKYAYVSETITGNLIVAARAANNSLTKILAIELDSGVDNVDVSSDFPNEIFIGSHPNSLLFIKHALFGGKAPSQVIKVSFASTEDDPSKQVTITKNSHYEFETIFESVGDDISASSVAARYKNQIIIGPVFDDHVLLCNLN